MKASDGNFSKVLLSSNTLYYCVIILRTSLGNTLEILLTYMSYIGILIACISALTING